MFVHYVISAALSLSVALSLVSRARADPEACEELADRLNAPRTSPNEFRELFVKAVRVTWRREAGFHTFTMGRTYNMLVDGYNTPAAAAKSWFVAGPRLGGAFEGEFVELFPGDDPPGAGTVRSDSWRFTLNGAGRITLRNLTWDPTPVTLPNLDCHAGADGQVVATSVGNTTDFGQNFWTFLLVLRSSEL